MTDYLPYTYIFFFCPCTYSRWMCSPTNRFCIETLSGHLQCVPRQRPAARQGCAPAGRSQWRHRWCPAAWAALHRWFWRPSLSVREISPKYCAEKVERNSVRATVFIKVDFIKVSKVVKNLNSKFGNSSSYHLRDRREIMLKVVYCLYLEYKFNVSASKQKYKLAKKLHTKYSTSNTYHLIELEKSSSRSIFGLFEYINTKFQLSFK